MSKKRGPLKATDRRRNAGKSKGVRAPESDTDGSGPALADLFNDRRHANGTGKKAF
jgi:hypothetical protein